VLEGYDQKQADLLSRSLVRVDPKRLHELYLVISSIRRLEHLTLFKLGIAKKSGFRFAGPQSLRISRLLEDGRFVGRLPCARGHNQTPALISAINGVHAGCDALALECGKAV
jgi:hypothetical protein